MSSHPRGTISTQDLFESVVPPLTKLVGLALHFAGFARGFSLPIIQSAFGELRLLGITKVTIGSMRCRHR